MRPTEVVSGSLRPAPGSATVVVPMRTFPCVCGATLFFENTRCLKCGRETGWCPPCGAIVPLDPAGGGDFRCALPDCGVELRKCANYREHDVCNRMIPAEDGGEALCDVCRYNRTVPDLSVEGNAKKWLRLEQAKRRMFYNLDLLGLPYGTEADGFELPLGFDFKADTVPADADRHEGESEGEQVYTGHADGLITINIKEADSVEREKARVSFGERQRTLVGHFRHEVGHYYWQLLVQDKDEAACVAVFGDHNDPTYADALDEYYKNGPREDWRGSFVSPYATMHAWEDFAETFAAYLDLAAVLDTAAHAGVGRLRVESGAGVGALVEEYARVGTLMTEMNRTMGLPDYVPQTFGPGVLPKLAYLHALVGGAGGAVQSHR